MVSKEFKIAVRMADKPAWKIAREAGIHPVTLSRLVTGYLQPKPGDSRVLAVARVLGLPLERCFSEGETWA
jgi:hypothetical protein